MIKKYLNYNGLETLVDLIKQRFEPIEEAIGRDEDNNLVAVTDRIKDEACDADYKEKEVTVYTFTQDDKTFIITSKDILTAKTADDILADDETTKLSDIYPDKTLREIVSLLEEDPTVELLMYSIRDQLDELIEQTSYRISKVKRINDNQYEIDVTNGETTITSNWTVEEQDDGSVIWQSNEDDTISMIGFEPDELVGKFWKDENGIIKGEYFNDYDNNIASGDYSHSEGQKTIASNVGAHAEGVPGSDFVEGSIVTFSTTAAGAGSHAEGRATSAVGDCAHSEGSFTYASEPFAHVEGYHTSVIARSAHAEGSNCLIDGRKFNADGEVVSTSGAHAAHIEGLRNIIIEGGYSNVGAHAEGYETTTMGGDGVHTEGMNTYNAGDNGAHAEGEHTYIIGQAGHAEGSNTYVLASNAHAEGLKTTANAENSHASGEGTISNFASETVIGRYNELESDTALLFEVGIGGSDTSRKTGFYIDNSGNAISISDIGIKNENNTISLNQVYTDVEILKTKPEVKIEISKEANNIITMNSDGLYAAKTEIPLPSISKDLNNIIELRTDGLYATTTTLEFENEDIDWSLWKKDDPEDAYNWGKMKDLRYNTVSSYQWDKFKTN